MSSEAPKDDEPIQNRPESPPLGLLDPSRIQNPLAADQHQNQPASGFVMPEQPRQQPLAPPQQQPQGQQHWQRTPTMSPANVFPAGAGSGTPGSQRSSTGSPNHQMAAGQPPQGHVTPQHQQQFSFHESPAYSQGTPVTPQSSGAPPGSNCGTPQSAGHQMAPQQGPPPPQQVPYDYQAVQMQQQQQAQAMAQQQFGAPPPGQMHESPFRGHPQIMAMHPHHPAQYPPGYPQPNPGVQWQQQQQMYARQQAAVVAAQRAQRVPVPYPQGAYPQGIPGAPGPMTPVYPPQPSPATRSTPGSAGPGSGPPTTPQRPQYPMGTNPQPQPHPQFAYPPAQPQVTPTGQPPGYPGQLPGTPTFSSPAHQMYRQGPPTFQGPQGMRAQYISPQAGQPQPAPGTPHRFVAQKPPPGTTSSPHFAAAPGQMGPDIRSPPTIMSPNQQQVMQQQVSQQHTPVRVIHSDMGQMGQMRPIALPPQQQPGAPQGTPQQAIPMGSAGQFAQFRAVVPPQAMHHDPNTFPMPQVNHDPELFLAGLYIHCFDVEKLIQDRLDRDNLEFIIKYHGGEIEFDPTKFAERVGQITHVLVDSYRNPAARPALESRKRLISMQWIADVLERGQPEIPWRLAHLPGPFFGQIPPQKGRLFSVSGFDETERPAICFMAEAMGAQISPFLAKGNDLLIAKGPSEKVTKAFEWKIPVVNFQWIADSYVCGNLPPPDLPNVENPRYQLGSPCSGVNTAPGNIEMASADFANMIRCWKQAVIITDQAQQKAKENRKEMQSDESQFPCRRLANQGPAPTDEAIKAHQKELAEHAQRFKEQEETRKKREKAGVPLTKLLAEMKIKEPQPTVIAFFGDGFDSETLAVLQRKMAYLGGKCAESIEKATHVVMLSGRRNLTLLEAIIRGKNIVDPEWIVHSYTSRRWHDTLDYFLCDKKIEKELAYSCKRSVLRARTRRVFEDVEFHVTRFVEPSQTEIVRLIEAAGGIVHPNKPEPMYLAKCIESEQPFIIVSCENDARTLTYLVDTNMPIYNVDLVLFAMLRQNIEPLPQYRVWFHRIKPPLIRQPPPYSAPQTGNSA